MNYRLLFILFATVLISCTAQHENKYEVFDASNESFSYSGRQERINDSTHALISSASNVIFNATGDSIVFLIDCVGDSTSYVVIELNGNYYERFRIMKDSVNRIGVALNAEKNNKVGLYKATEASNGSILFYGVEAESIHSSNLENKPLIEFIGNSITCGFGADTREIACDSGTWYDKHNAYLAYGPIVARDLDLNYQLSSVSGIGIYRNWNDEDSDPVMGDVYFTTYLDGNTNKLWDFPGQVPDLVSICLGTNDVSDGDGIKPRKPFNAEKYINNYIDLAERIFERYPNTKMTLLTSPMLSLETNKMLLSCLQKVKAHFDGSHSISIFEFSLMRPNGCGGHPSLEDHEMMAKQLIPFYAKELKN